jgi:hypothetical protein
MVLEVSSPRTRDPRRVACFERRGEDAGLRIHVSNSNDIRCLENVIASEAKQSSFGEAK